MIKVFEEFSSQRDIDNLQGIFESLTDKYDFNLIECYRGSETIFNFQSKERIEYHGPKMRPAHIDYVCLYKGSPRNGDLYCVEDGWLLEDVRFREALENDRIDLKSKLYSEFYSIGFNTNRDYASKFFYGIYAEIWQCVRRVKSLMGLDLHNNKDLFWRNGISNKDCSGFYFPIDWTSGPKRFELGKFGPEIEYWMFFKCL